MIGTVMCCIRQLPMVLGGLLFRQTGDIDAGNTPVVGWYEIQHVHNI